MTHASKIEPATKPHRWNWKDRAASKRLVAADTGFIGLAVMALIGCLAGYIILAATG